MLQYFEGRPLIRICAQHRVDQSLEGIRKETRRLVAFVDLPKLSKPVVSDLSIDLIVDSSAEERNWASIHDEKNDSSREYVHLQPIINSSLYLRSPIAISPNSHSIYLTCLFLGMPEIRKLESEIEVKEYILRLKVAMRDSNLMEILDCSKELSYVVPW